MTLLQTIEEADCGVRVAADINNIFIFLRFSFFQGRSKSLTNLDAIGVSANDDMESSSETDNDMLDVPNSAR